MRRRTGIFLRVLGFLVALPFVWLLAINVFLSTGLPIVLSRQPDRLKLTYDLAWMLVPGKVEVRNIEIRQQGLRDQWLLTVDRATVVFDLRGFFQHTVHITTARGNGASFRWRARLDGSPRMGPPSLLEEKAAQRDSVVENLSPPIPGLSNPPNPPPEAIYPPAKPWRVVLGDLQVGGIRELWLGDYRYTGDAKVSGALTLEARKWLEAEGVELDLDGGVVDRGSDLMLTNLRGQISAEVVGTNPVTTMGRDLLGAISGKVVLDADIANLSFLGFYLQAAPWLRLRSGVGKLGVDVIFENGAFVEGSNVAADVHDIVVRFLSYSVVGDGEVRLTVSQVDGMPQSAFTVDFLDFAITHDGDEVPHAKGRGFQLLATTADVALDRPFTALDVVLELPQVEIPDVRVYNTYLPRSIGLVLQSGSGEVRGHLAVSTDQDLCNAELFLDGHAVRATLDALTLSGNFDLYAVVPSCNLETSWYDISGTTLDLEGIRVVSRTPTRHGKDDSKGWWAKIQLPKGNVAVGAPTYLDSNIEMNLRDSIPFVTVFSEKQALPRWMRGILGVGPVAGKARVRLGSDVVRVSDFELLAGKFAVLLELRRRQQTEGKLYARYGPLSVGLNMASDDRRIHLLHARKWYDAEPNPD
jgi:hypothetical protein